MARKFVRNITGTKLRGKNKEPLKTNIQNDILSDEEDAYIRNKDEYHCLTDNLKDLTTSTPSIVTIKNGKNSSNIDVKETKIESESERITINNPNPNDFKINIDLSDIENITDIGDGEFPEIDLSNYALRKDLNKHTEDKNNPHNVTLNDLGINENNLKETKISSTDKITEIKNPSPNEFEINVKETELESESERLKIEKISPNKFKINTDLSDIENIIDKGDGKYPEIDLSNYALREDLNNHTEDFNNPHKVNLEDLGIENLPETVTNIENDLSNITTIISEGNNKMTTKYYNSPNVDVYLNKSEDVKECILIDIDYHRDLRIQFRESSGGYPVKSKFIIRNFNSDSRRLTLRPDPIHIFTLNGKGNGKLNLDLEGQTILVLTVLYNIPSKDGKREIFIYEDARIPLDEVV